MIAEDFIQQELAKRGRYKPCRPAGFVESSRTPKLAIAKRITAEWFSIQFNLRATEDARWYRDGRPGRFSPQDSAQTTN